MSREEYKQHMSQCSEDSGIDTGDDVTVEQPEMEIHPSEFNQMRFEEAFYSMNSIIETGDNVSAEYPVIEICPSEGNQLRFEEEFDIGASTINKCTSAVKQQCPQCSKTVRQPMMQLHLHICNYKKIEWMKKEGTIKGTMSLKLLKEKPERPFIRTENPKLKFYGSVHSEEKIKIEMQNNSNKKYKFSFYFHNKKNFSYTTLYKPTIKKVKAKFIIPACYNYQDLWHYTLKIVEV